MISKRQSISDVSQLWKGNWDSSRLVWSPFVKLREPIWCMTSGEANKEGLTGSFAMIRLNDHRIVIDLEEICKRELGNYSLQVLAHEIGHHVYAPANLHDNAVLLNRIRWGLPDIEDRAPFVSNLYTDFLINDTLQRIKQLDMVSVYRQVNKEIEFSELWMLVMRTYEYLWKLNRGTLASDTKYHSLKLDADASLTATLIRSYSKKWIEGAGRFAAMIYPYIIEENDYTKSRKSFIGTLDAEYAGDQGGVVSGMTELDLEGMEGAVDPREEAVGEASKERKNTFENAFGRSLKGGDGPRQRYLGPGPYMDLMRQINPNVDEQQIINNYYREIALPYLISFPMQKNSPISFTLPEGTDTWDISDPLEEIDWLETTIASPTIFPGYNTRKRIYGEDQGDSQIKKPLDVYIGMDCSGSMTNPRYAFSWPVLAATIIGLSALRAGANVMGCLSGEPGSFMETKGFVNSEIDLLNVLTSYLGTGYAYGIPRLNTPFGEKRKEASHVIIVTDDDLFRMLGDISAEESNWKVIEQALKNAGGLGTIVLHSHHDWHKDEVQVLLKMGWKIHYVTNEQQILEFAFKFSEENYDRNKNGK